VTRAPTKVFFHPDLFFLSTCVSRLSRKIAWYLYFWSGKLISNFNVFNNTKITLQCLHAHIRWESAHIGWSRAWSKGFIFSYKIIITVIYSGVFKGTHARHLPRAPFATVMCKVAYLAFKWGPTVTAMYKWATLLSKAPPTAVAMWKYLAFKGAQNNCNALCFQWAP